MPPPATADPDTQHDVHVMLLDYLLCINISRIIHSKIAGNHELDCDWDVNIWWLINTIESMFRNRGSSHDLSTLLLKSSFDNLVSLTNPHPQLHLSKKSPMSSELNFRF